MPVGTLGGLCPRCLGSLAVGEETKGSFASGSGADPWRDDERGCERGSRFRFGDFEVLGEIASGGMGIVYRARQISLNRVVALKMVRGARLRDPSAIHRFHTEAEAAARLHHPNIVAVHDFGEIEGQHFYTMDFVEGRSLAQCTRAGPTAAERAAGWVRALAEAMHYAHQRGILHRDLKPSNVLIDQEGRPRITDFGLAKLMLSDGDLTVTGQVMGSPSYMAPEQAEGRWHDVSIRSDVYALGAVLYELVTGHPPFRADSAMATLKLVIERPAVPPRQRNSGLPEDLDAICLKCLEKDPARRYGSAKDLAEDLGRFLRGVPILARSIGRGERCWRWSRRNPRMAGAVGVAVLALVLGVAGILWEWRLAESYRRQAEAEERVARHQLYAADLYAAAQAYAGGNWGLVRRLLAAHRPAAGEEDLRGFEWRHLASEVRGSQVAVLRGHSNLVTALAFSPDGRWLASAGREGRVRIWSVADRVSTAVLTCATGHVYRLAFSSDGRRLAVGTTEGVQLWETGSWAVTGRLAVPSAAVAFAPSGPLLAIGESNVIWGTRRTGSTRLWDTVRDVEVLRLPEAGGRVAFSPDGKVLAAGNQEDEFGLWEVASGRRVAALVHGFRLLDVAFSPDGRYLGTTQWDQGPRLWSAADAAPLGPLGEYRSRVRVLAFSPDSRSVAVAGADQTVDIWDTGTRRLRARLRGHGEEIWSLAYSPDGRLLASAGRDAGVFLWDTAVRKPANTLTGVVELLGYPIFALSPGGARVAATTLAGVGVWEVSTLQPTVAFLDGESPLCFLRDENTLVTLRAPADLLTWDLVRTQVVSRVHLPVPFDRVNDCRLSPSGHWIAFGDAGGVLHLVEAASGRRVGESRAHFRYVLALGFDPTEAFLASADRSGDAFLWTVPGLALRATLRGHGDYVRGLAVSPDGRRVVTASADCTARLWTVPEGKEEAVLRGHGEELNDVAFSPDGRTLATSSYDRTVRLWHLETLREMAVLPHQDRVLRLAFSADGGVLAALGRDGSIRFWRAPVPEE
jgi:WD40 repeat protein/tRNA A-37 threonylcarbamoyl transferase component Bud32